ncbi:MAG: hypothetical protein U0325_01455 [Polyangiales bacterium]
MTMLCVLSSPMGCQLIKRLTNRGQDAGTVAAPTTPVTPTPVPAEVDAGAVAVPNPTVAPMPTADDAGAPAAPVADDAGAPPPPPAEADAGAPPPPAVVDAGVAAAPPPVVPTVAEPAPGTPRRRGPRNFCKDHPGQCTPRPGRSAR